MQEEGKWSRREVGTRKSRYPITKPSLYQSHPLRGGGGRLPGFTFLRTGTGASSSSYSSTSYSSISSTLRGSLIISSSNVIAVVRGMAVEKDDDTPSGVGNAARRVLAGGGTVTVKGGRVSYWIIVLVSVSATMMGGSSYWIEGRNKSVNCSALCEGRPVGSAHIQRFKKA